MSIQQHPFPASLFLMTQCPLVSTNDMLQRTTMRSACTQRGSRGRGSGRKGRGRWKTVSRAWKFCCGQSLNRLNRKTPCRAHPYLTARPTLPSLLEARPRRRIAPEPYHVRRLSVPSWRGTNRHGTYKEPLHEGRASVQWCTWLLLAHTPRSLPRIPIQPRLQAPRLASMAWRPIRPYFEAS